MLLGGSERELLLFTNGFVLSRVEISELMKLILDASSTGNMDDMTAEDLERRFSAIDADHGGCE